MGLHPPYERFYLEAILLSTANVLDAGESIREALDFGMNYPANSKEWNESAFQILNGAQDLATQAAAVGRYFWPIRPKEVHVDRSKKLRELLKIDDLSALRFRTLRNRLEHFDERLDEFFASLRAGELVQVYVGPRPLPEERFSFRLRAFFTDEGVIEILGEELSLQPILDEIRDIHNRVVDLLEKEQMPSAQ